MWSDNETVDDLIGFKVHADLIRSVVTDPMLLPATVGVFGDWGNGKTSIMQMLRRDLDPDHTDDPAEKQMREKIAVLYFNGWLFEGYDDAKAALLSSILQELRDHKRFGPKVRDAALSLLKRVDVMRAIKLGWRAVGAPLLGAQVAAATGMLPPQIGTLAASVAFGEQADEDDKNSILEAEKTVDATMDLRGFRDEFGKMLRDSGMSSLVVLIDDLDRCSPETIIDNLEAIKLFLNVENTAFVIGADRRIVRHAIAVRYHDTIAAGKEDAEGDLRLADDYLEKLIQIPYSLPRLSPSEIETYMTLLFCRRDLSEENYRGCLQYCDELRNQNRFRAFGMSDVQAALRGVPLPPRLHEALGIVALAANMITECLSGNPRQVKRFLNAYTLRRKLATVARMESLRDEVLIKLMLLEYSEYSRFKELARWQEGDRGVSKQLHVAEEAANGAPGAAFPAGWESDRVRRWLAMDPRLSDVDLSEYFWLARDKLASSMTGLTMVAPVVRKAFESLLKKVTRPAALVSTDSLAPEELESLHELLTRSIQRDSKNQEALDAFRELVGRRPLSAQAHAGALMTIPAEKMDASLPGMLELLIKQHPHVSSTYQPVLDRISKEPGTRAGKALTHRARGK